MLFAYFLRRFFICFVCVLIGIVPVFASCDMLVRLIAIPITHQVLSFFFFIIPLVAVFAIPISSCIAVSISVGKLFVADEILSFFFWRRARAALFAAVAIFSLFVGAIFTPLVFEWAPQSYWQGKNFIVELAKTHIENLEAGRFHTVCNVAMFFFESKQKDLSGVVRFNKVLCSFSREGKRYFISAEHGTFTNGELGFFGGSLVHEDNGKRYVTSFQKMFVALERLVNSSAAGIAKTSKFMGFRELINGKKQNDSLWLEFHRRILQTVWQFLFPLLALFAIIIFGRKKSNLLLSSIITGLLFLFSYISTNIAVSMLQRNWTHIVLLYAVPLIVSLPLYVGYIRKW